MENIMENIEFKSHSYKEAVYEAESEYDNSSITYYVSNTGDDNSDGRSPQTAWRSLEKVNAQSFDKGSVVLFERGGEWRGKVMCRSGVTYSAYGEGEKPLFIGSKKNYADPSLWERTNDPRIWVCTEKLYDVGIIAIDHRIRFTENFGNNSDIVAIKRLDKCLYNDLEFYSDLETNELFFYSLYGNPGQRFMSLEIGQRDHIFSIRTSPDEPTCSDITIDNVMLAYTGSHAIGSESIHGLTVRNCVIAWIGGAVHTGIGDGKSVQYGNAIEIYGRCDGFYVYNNYIYQIFDTAMTFQFSQCPASVDMRNVEFYNNIVENCHWSFEWYNQPSEGYVRTVANVNVHDNIYRLGGYGWGSRFRRKWATLCLSSLLPEETENFIVKDNILDRCTGPIIRVFKGGDEKIVFENNIIVQHRDRLLCQIPDGRYIECNDDAEAILKQNNHIGTKLFILEEN